MNDLLFYIFLIGYGWCSFAIGEEYNKKKYMRKKRAKYHFGKEIQRRG